ncbi:MAG: hypothetical protein AABY15_00965 [Nanoarchaeota archaeon]
MKKRGRPPKIIKSWDKKEELVETEDVVEEELETEPEPQSNSEEIPEEVKEEGVLIKEPHPLIMQREKLMKLYEEMKSENIRSISDIEVKIGNLNRDILKIEE